MGVEGSVRVGRVVGEVLDAVRVDLNRRRYFVDQTSARRVEMDAYGIRGMSR